MTLEALAYLAQIVSTVVVALSLVYLATQVRQTTKSQQAENYGRALDRLAAMQSRLSDDGELSSMFSRAIADPASVTPQQRIQITWGLFELFGAMEFMYHQALDGMLPMQVWARWETTLAWWLRFPGVQAWWRARPTPFSDELTSLVERLIADPPPASAHSEAWRAFLRGRVAPGHIAPPATPPPAATEPSIPT